MPEFEVKGRGTVSGRTRKRVYKAANEEEARQIAIKDGTDVEECNQLLPKPPTENQISYATDLGIDIPPGASWIELSDLISIKENSDKPSTERHRRFAEHYGLSVTNYVGKRVLFERIFDELVKTGRENELAEWFVFRVYRDLVKGIEDAEIQEPQDPLIQSVAREMVSDPALLKSIRGYGGRTLIWFGEWTAPNGTTYQGDSNRTIAYRKARSLLSEKVGTTAKTPRVGTTAKTPRDVSLSPKTGCLGCSSLPVLAIIVILIVILSSLT